MDLETDLIWTTVKRKVNDLIAFDKNPWDITTENLAILRKSLKKNNLVETPVINTDNVIIAGHKRVGLLKEAGRGEEVIDVRMPNRKLSEEELWEYNSRSNIGLSYPNFDKLSLAPFDEEQFEAMGFKDFPEFENEGIEEEEQNEPLPSLMFTLKVAIDPTRDDANALEAEIKRVARKFETAKIQKITS